MRCSYRCLTCAPMVLEHEHDPERVPLYRFLGPRYWLLWLGLGLVRALNTLPLRWQMAIGRGLGRIAYAVSRRDRRIADINVRLCLPGLTAQEREDLVRDHFESLGCALLETGLVWWASPAAPAATDRLRGRGASARGPGERPRRADAERALHHAGDGRARAHAARPDQHHVPHAEECADRRAVAPQPRPAHRAGRSPATRFATCCRT